MRLPVLKATDPLMMSMKIALWGGLLLAAPFWLYQLWAFIAPGLHKHERRWAYMFGAIAVPLFFLGAVLASLVVSKGLHFLLTTGAVKATSLEASNYLSFVTNLVLLFGLSFEFPVLLLLLNFTGMVRGKRMLGWWRVAIIVFFAFAAITTPDPGPFGMTCWPPRCRCCTCRLRRRDPQRQAPRPQAPQAVRRPRRRRDLRAGRRPRADRGGRADRGSDRDRRAHAGRGAPARWDDMT